MNFGQLTSPAIAAAAPNVVAVLPIAAVEQHGSHLPVDTDSAIATELGRRAEAALPGEILLLPTLWAGSSHHHLPFSGTLSVRSETFVRVLEDLIESLLRSGFRRIFILNGHAGNEAPFAEALYRISLLQPSAWIAAQSYWKLAEPALAAQKFMSAPGLSHACEYETSLMLALDAPVKMDRARGCCPEVASEFYDPLDFKPSRVMVKEPFVQLTKTGALGFPEMATCEKGEKLFAIFAESIVDFLNDFKKWPYRNGPVDLSEERKR